MVAAAYDQRDTLRNTHAPYRPRIWQCKLHFHGFRRLETDRLLHRPVRNPGFPGQHCAVCHKCAKFPLLQLLPDCLLVFSTFSPDHALEGYRVQAAQYLVKPYAAAELERVFDQLARLLPAPEKYLELRTGRQTVRLRLGDILWAEHYQHQVRVHTAGGEVLSTRLTFGEFAALLSSDSRFFVCGRGLLVNLDHAADFDGRDFRLSDRTRLPVSRDLTVRAKIAFCDRLFHQGKGAVL